MPRHTLNLPKQQLRYSKLFVSRSFDSPSIDKVQFTSVCVCVYNKINYVNRHEVRKMITVTRTARCHVNEVIKKKKKKK